MAEPGRAPLEWISGSPIGRTFRRPLTGGELEQLRAARSSNPDGLKGAEAAFMRLWDILLGDAHDLTYTEATERYVATGRRFDVRAYALPQEQAAEVFMILHGDLTGRASKHVGILWVDLGPADYDPEGDTSRA